MRGILPEASRGLRDKRIFRYAGRSAGADRKRSESAAAIEVLPVTATPPGRSRAELVDDDVHQSVVTDQVRGFAERIALAGQRISRARDPRHDLHLLCCGSRTKTNSGVVSDAELASFGARVTWTRTAGTVPVAPELATEGEWLPAPAAGDAEDAAAGP